MDTYIYYMYVWDLHIIMGKTGLQKWQAKNQPEISTFEFDSLVLYIVDHFLDFFSLNHGLN